MGCSGINKSITQLANKTWIAEVLAMCGGILYLVQAIQNAYMRTSFLDEGLYLFKGWLFASGQYQPFVPYGPWTTQMPLSYLIPGVVQVLFGPGLRPGRYFAILLGILTLLALWLVTRQLAGRWWGAIVVWSIALNIATIKVYTLAISEVLVACLFSWTLYFILGSNRSIWQIVAGSILSAMIFMVRINLAPVVVLVVLFIFWQHGRQKGWIALLTSGAILLISHAVYWPGILSIWAAWLPKDLTPFLNAWRLSTSTGKWVTSAALPDVLERVLYFFLSFRLHLLSLGGALIVWLLWPGKSTYWKNLTQFRTAVFLSATLLLLLIMHMLAAFFLGFCISCILLYITFFDFLGLLLLAQSWNALPKKQHFWREILAGLILFGMGLGIFFSAFSDISANFVRNFPYFYLWSKLDRILWPLLKTVGYLQSEGIIEYKVLQIRSAIYTGFAVMTLAFGLSYLAAVVLRRRKSIKVSGIFILICLVLAVSLIFSSTKYLSGGNDFFACEGNVLVSYEQSGTTLQEMIPEGSKVFWIGRIPALLLYLPDSQFYLPQLNHFHNFRFGGEDTELEKFGLWNKLLGRKWFDDADVILVEEDWMDGWVMELIKESGLQSTKILPPVESCRPESSIHVYIKPPASGPGEQH